MLSNIKQRKYLLLLLYFPFYLTWFYILERTVVTDYWVSYLPLDDLIPFVPQFVFAYCAWYFYLLIPGLYLLLRDVAAFKRFMWFFMISFTICLLTCTVFPNGQNLRPTDLTPDTFSKRLILAIYSADTNTNVLPSMHIVGTAAVVYGAWHSRTLRRPWWFVPIVVLGILICASTVCIKQHSVLDILTGLLVCVPLWLLLDRVGQPSTTNNKGAQSS